MTAMVKRRSILTAGGAAAALLVVGGAAGWRALLPGAQPSPEDAATEFVKLLDDVHADYVNGRVVEHEGWVLSQHEYDTIGQRQQEQHATAAAGVS